MSTEFDMWWTGEEAHSLRFERMSDMWPEEIARAAWDAALAAQAQPPVHTPHSVDCRYDYMLARLGLADAPSLRLAFWDALGALEWTDVTDQPVMPHYDSAACATCQENLRFHKALSGGFLAATPRPVAGRSDALTQAYAEGRADQYADDREVVMKVFDDELCTHEIWRPLMDVKEHFANPPASKEDKE